MKPIVEIMQRVEHLKKRILLLDTLKSREMDKPGKARNYNLLLFFVKERNMYSCALTQLQWLLGIEDKKTI